MPNSNHKLSPCPASPNCVSSLSTDRKHSVEPLQYTGSPDEARQKILEILGTMERTNVTRADADYIHAEFRSRIFKFVDDLELFFPTEGGVIHIRSASRVGYSDLGANRKRVEQIRQAFGSSS